MPQRSGEHCTTLGEHMLGGLSGHLREAAAAHLASTCYRGLGEHLLGEHPRAPLLGEHPWVESYFLIRRGVDGSDRADGAVANGKARLTVQTSSQGHYR